MSINCIKEDINNLVTDQTLNNPPEEQLPKRGEGVSHPTVHASSFKEFKLKPEIIRAIGDCGFEHPTEVQQQCIPHAILGTDVLCQAKSGTGKTVVFVLSILQQLESRPNETLSLVLVHTRDLAFQIHEEFDRFKKYMPWDIKTRVIYGGNPVSCDRKELQTSVPCIVIGTPGRTLNLVRQRLLKLTCLNHLVLDDCDKMLQQSDMRKDVQAILSFTPSLKQVMMFSRTLAPEIRTICKRIMHNPKEISIDEGGDLRLARLQQYSLDSEEKEKKSKLVDLLDRLEFNQVIIFVSSSDRVNMLNKFLQAENFPSISSYGKAEEEKRKFKQTIMVMSTNHMVKGMENEGVNIVINYDMPATEDEYLHRVGRPGRFKTKGLAVSFVITNEDKIVLEKVRKKFVVDLPEVPDTIDRSTYMTS